MTDVHTGAVPELEVMVDEFERTVFAQEPVTADHYDTDYFADDWRERDNKYDVETRRRVEARNPELIKEVFAPERVLDVGCGPGFLMLFLSELGIDVAGVDFAPASKPLAPAAVRDRITIGEVADSHFPARSFDLVVCREVMEHLSILQVRRTVAQICRASSRFVYVTTRYHPAPRHLLDVTTDFETDPTHITLMTMDLMRVLFVLEGFQRRADLERRMDWADKRRVLVYERHTD
jgi:2-polyprenyl-3-methyl-5-hydroxy-6-metoxy-1,4-benzoquinol methylase